MSEGLRRLDEIEDQARAAVSFRSKERLLALAREDVPALVRALRVALEGLERAIDLPGGEPAAIAYTAALAELSAGKGKEAKR